MKDKPAYPFLKRTEISDYGSTQNFGWYGLTRRELFAAMAMQGLLSDLAGIRAEGFRDREIEEFALLRADALIAALDGEQS